MSHYIFDLSNPDDMDIYSEIVPNEFKKYFLFEGMELSNNISKNKRLCFVFQEGGNLCIYHFIKKQVPLFGNLKSIKYYDISGEYGYNGPVIVNGDNFFIKKFIQVFKQYCKEENIIAEFIRFNSILENHRDFTEINSIKVNQQIVIDLRRDDIYDKCYEYSTRKNIKKAERNNLICKIYSCNQMTSKLASDFHEVYINTMERNQANKEYYYSLGYFENIRNRYPDKALFVFVYQEKKVVSMELILHNEYMGFSYLGGTDSKYYNCRPNDYLKHNIIFYLKEKGVYFFNMGGGHEINDGIFKYKKNFCIDGVFDYYIGRVIHNQTTYDQIVNSWKGVTCIDDINKYDNYLLKYHFGSKI